ncbi:hypothetical protein BJ138DRAFT_1119048 [Hygrophoropsis aurantiaca]|uniref:Uncharacterized protein n=1 Tax=Hygrophoropsis aurantiaca TaxID=72124 RepID=A0ACB7ZVR7_9AGAM|nr:hypothetical protein BJ138DRAFT_1119048 [Hygrophoropsis aurantiaca]
MSAYSSESKRPSGPRADSGSHRVRPTSLPTSLSSSTSNNTLNRHAAKLQPNRITPAYAQSGEMASRVLKHDSLYFYDGNVALIALTATGEPLVFRVHKSILSKNSLVFANMFLESRGDGETRDGVPVFRVPEDSGMMESLLNVLYHPEYFASSTTESTLSPPIFRRRLFRPPSDMVNILTMANKYKLHDLCKSIVLRLETDWPQTLAEWDLAEAEFTSMDVLSSQDGNEGLRASYVHLDDWYPEPVSAIQIARECDVPSILPAAFYHLSRLSAVQDNLGQRQQHGPPQFLPRHRSAQWDDLSAKDLLCLIKGRENIAQTDLGLIFSDDCGCGGQHPCIGLKNCGLVEEINRERGRTSDALALLQSYADRPDYGDRICAQCCAFMKGRLRKARRVLWVQLPELFQLLS